MSWNHMIIPSYTPHSYMLLAFFVLHVHAHVFPATSNNWNSSPFVHSIWISCAVIFYQHQSQVFLLLVFCFHGIQGGEGGRGVEDTSYQKT